MSTRILRRIACIVIALGIGVLWMPSSAEANMRLELAVSNGGGATGTIVTDTGNTGVLTDFVSIGNFVVNVTTGTSFPPLTPPHGVIAELDLSSLNVSASGGGTLTIILENTGYTGPIENLSAVGSIGGTLSGAGSVTASMWVDPTNAVPALGADQGVGAVSIPSMPGSGLQALSFANNGSPFAGSGGTSFSSPGTFSLFEKFVITFNGAGNFSADGNVTVVPEPSSLAVAGIGALGMIGFGLRRRKAMGA
jgi:hypothetical protein